MKKIKICLCGFGYWGKNILRNLLDMDNVEVAAICDLNENNLKKATDLAIKNGPYNPKFISTANYEHILLEPEIDAVVIVTPPTTHYELAMRALKAGKHVFIEKPMTVNYQEAIDIVNQGILSQKKVMVGHTFIYHPVINDLKKLIDNGELGDIYSISLEMVNLGKFQQQGVLWDLLPHGISIILYLLNNPEVTSVAVNGTSAISKGLIDNAYLTLYFKNESFSTIHVSWLHPCKERKLTVVGSRQMAIFDDLNASEPLKIYNKGVSKDKTFSSWGESMVGYRHGNIVSLVTSTGEPIKIELQHFIQSILTNQEPKTSGSNGAQVIKIIEEAVEKLNENLF